MFTKIGSMLHSNKVKLPIHLHFPRLCSFAFQDEFSCGHVRFEGPGNRGICMGGIKLPGEWCGLELAVYQMQLNVDRDPLLRIFNR